ncbi:MAG: exodeoxyribonuclease III [Bdellovibrionia bacterium]
MKIVSWNVNGIRACYKKGLLDFIENEAPDIFCIQETKAHIEQVEDEVKDLGYKNYYWSSAKRKGYSGVASFMDKAPKSIKKGIGIEAYDSEGRIVWTEHEGFDLYNIYFPNGGSGEERHLFKQQFLKDLSAHLKAELKSGKEIVVVGDYNVAHKEIDVYDPVRLAKESGFLPEERQWFDTFLELGFVDTFRLFEPQAKEQFTWWSYREFARVANRGWRIDYICVSAGLKDKVKAAGILQEVEGSDHCPVMIKLEI